MIRFAMVLLVGAAGCSAARSPSPESPAPQQTDLEAIYRARSDSALLRFTAADVRFMTGMIGHHTQALVMAGLARSHGAAPAIETLAARIINAQQDEIATMQQWLRDRGQPVPEVHVAGATMMVHGPDYVMHMPGMLTPEQLRELDAARGGDLDRLFLQYMIQHHRGAVVMVTELFGTDGAGQEDVIFKLASDIHVDQITEIARMELMLEEMKP